MIRTLALFAAALLVGCQTPAPRHPINMGGAGGDTGGAGGSAGSVGTGGSGGSSYGGSGGNTGGSGGSGGSVATGGSGGSSTGGSGGSATGGSGGAPADGPAAADAAKADGGGGDAGDLFTAGEEVAGRPWIRLCPKAWDQTRCCMYLCQCLGQLCTDSPMDASRIPMCMSMCSKLTDFRARCQVFHCFESKNPGAVKDHASHCGHASGRVGGGSCDTITNQK
jgi:hypothetical protein